MLFYSKLKDEKTREHEVINQEQAKLMGWQQNDLDVSFDGRFFEKGYATKIPLDELKALKREEINQARDNAEQGGFEYMGKIFDSDQVSCQRISCAAQAMSVLTMSAETPTITWTCQDNTTIDLSASELMGLVVALAQWSNSCHEKATALKAQIDACTGKEELDAITWE